MHKYMTIAHAVAGMSKDDTKVGAVVVGASNEIRSIGYNGAPRGCKADEDDRRAEKLWWFSHAELNSITNAARVGIPLEGSTLYTTHYPCMDCAKAVVQAGIKKVVVGEMTERFKTRWAEHIKRSEVLFKECGIEVLQDGVVNT